MVQNQITLLNGRTLPCYPKVESSQPIDNQLKLDTTGKFLVFGRKKTTAQPTPPEVEQERQRVKKFFTDHAFFFLDHRERILNDSRMFLAPVPIHNNIAYTGVSGFQNPTLGVYIEWWMSCAPAIIGRYHKSTWLVYHFAGSPLSGHNICGIVNPSGECRSESLPGPFSALWNSFMKVNTRYDEAKTCYEAYTLEEVVKLLEANDEGDNLLERELYLLRRENQNLRQEIVNNNKRANREWSNLRDTLMNAYLECKREKLEQWYADYCRKQEETKVAVDNLKLQQEQLKQQFRRGEITNKFYQQQLTPLKKKSYDLEHKLKFTTTKELAELLPRVYNEFGDTVLLSVNDVVEFLKKAAAEEQRS